MDVEHFFGFVMHLVLGVLVVVFLFRHVGAVCLCPVYIMLQ